MGHPGKAKSLISESLTRCGYPKAVCREVDLPTGEAKSRHIKHISLSHCTGKIVAVIKG